MITRRCGSPPGKCPRPSALQLM